MGGFAVRKGGDENVQGADRENCYQRNEGVCLLRSQATASLQVDFVKENPPLTGQSAIHQFRFVPLHMTVLEEKISAEGCAAGLDMARNRNVRIGIEPLDIRAAARRRKVSVTLLHIHRNGGFGKFAAQTFFRDPARQSDEVIVIAPTGIHVKVRIAMRQKKVTDDKLRLEIRRVEHIRVTMPLLSRTKEDVHPVF